MFVWFIGDLRLTISQGHIEGVIVMVMKCQFHWWRKPEYSEEITTEEITDLQQVSCVTRRKTSRKPESQQK